MSPSETSPAPSAENARIADMSEGGRSGTGGPQAMQVVAAQEKKSWIHKWADTGSKLFQIAALTVAGAWAWVGFKQTVAPGLETKVGSAPNSTGWPYLVLKGVLKSVRRAFR